MRTRFPSRYIPGYAPNMSPRREKLDAEIVRLQGMKDALDAHYSRVRWLWVSFLLIIPGLLFGGLLGGLIMGFLALAMAGVSTYLVQVRRFEVRSDISMIESYIERDSEEPRVSTPTVLGEGWNRYRQKG